MSDFEDALNILLEDIYGDVNLLEAKMLAASRLNLGISEIHLLEAVQSAPRGQPATISALSDWLGISLPSVTLAVNKLEAKGYVLRRRIQADGRLVQVVLTALGQKAERSHRYFHRRMARQITAELTGQEKAALMGGVKKLDDFLKRNIQKYEEKHGGN